MDSIQFCYWLQGFFEIADPERISIDEIKIIKDHLQLVFNKVTPSPTKDMSDFYKIPHCGSVQISSDPNVKTYWNNKQNLCVAPIVDYTQMFTCPDGTPCPSC